jgi:hypothetical protein
MEISINTILRLISEKEKKEEVKLELILHNDGSGHLSKWFVARPIFLFDDVQQLHDYLK